MSDLPDERPPPAEAPPEMPAEAPVEPPVANEAIDPDIVERVDDYLDDAAEPEAIAEEAERAEEDERVRHEAVEEAAGILKDGIEATVEDAEAAREYHEICGENGQYCLTAPTLRTETVYERPSYELLNIEHQVDKTQAFTLGSALLIGATAGKANEWRTSFRGRKEKADD